MAMMTVKEFGRYDFGSLGLISNAAGIAETGMASERDDLVRATMGTAIHGKTTRGIAAGEDFLDFSMDYRADHITGIFFSRSFPVILKYFADGDFRFHSYILWIKFIILLWIGLFLFLFQKFHNYFTLSLKRSTLSVCITHE